MNYETIGQFISKKRKEKNLTQKELASKIGVTDKAVSKWENGLVCPDVSLLEVLSNELDISILELLKGRKIEGEVIPVTELNDYVKDSISYSKISIEDKLKRYTSNILIFIVIFLLIILVVLNISHILYLNKEITIDPNEVTTEQLNRYSNNIDKKIELIKNNQGIYSLDDYNTMLRLINGLSPYFEEFKNTFETSKTYKITSIDENSEMVDLNINILHFILSKYSDDNYQYVASVNFMTLLNSYFNSISLESYKYYFSIYDNDYINQFNDLPYQVNIKRNILMFEMNELSSTLDEIVEVGEISE